MSCPIFCFCKSLPAISVLANGVFEPARMARISTGCNSLVLVRLSLWACAAKQERIADEAKAIVFWRGIGARFSLLMTKNIAVPP